mmetsp:Transcript_13861/g.20899  ORF Transcript_13861/g.20899 Transcript_13861/m.20899 type:complete len:268 (+) Transcript_13861:44-847(+)
MMTASTSVSSRDKLKALEKQRGALETEIKDLLETIPKEFRDTKKKPRYVDDEGFPRPDIDIWSIAEVRKKVVMLQNDHIALMQQMEKLLMTVFQNHAHTADEDIEEQRRGDESNTTATQQQKQQQLNAELISEQEKHIIAMKAFIAAESNDTAATAADESKQKESASISNQVDPHTLKPFYLIDKIFDQSPSQDAGLKTSDLVIKFGSMTFNNQSPKMMQQIVQQSVNKPIPVIVKRNPEGFITLQLTPQQWSGKGLLGCHLTPYNN